MVVTARMRLVAAAVLGLGVAVAAGAPAAVAAAAPVFTVSQVPVPADAYRDLDGHAQPSLFDISCGGTGFCVAVGSYLAASNGTNYTAPLIETYSGGVWAALRAPVPAGAAGEAYLRKVSCGGGTCTALGSFYRNSVLLPYLVTLTGGTWTAADVPYPADAKLAEGLLVNGLACSDSGYCYAVGSYYRVYDTAGDAAPWAFIATMTTPAGSPAWSTIQAPLPDFPPPYVSSGVPISSPNLWAVACLGSGGACQAVGAYSTDPSSGTPEQQGLIESISSGTATPGWATPVAGEQNNTWGASLTQIGCGHGACAALGQTVEQGSHYADQYLESGAGGSFTPAFGPVPSGGTQIGYGLNAASCGSSSQCVLVGSWPMAGGGSAPVIDTGQGTSWSAITAPVPANWAAGDYALLGYVSCASTTSCLAEPMSQEAYPPPRSDFLETLDGTTWTATQVPMPSAFSGNTTTMMSDFRGAACDAPQHCFAIAASYGLVVTWAVPSSPPSVTLTAPTAPFTLASSVSVSWTGKAGGAPIAHYVVQTRRAAWNGGFTSWTTPSAWAALSASTTHVSAALTVGYDSCFRVEAIDTLGHTSWSSIRCTAMPLDDKSLTASSSWTRMTSSAYYQGTYSVSTHLNATLTRTGAQFRRIAIVATKCPTCGKVGVYAGTTLLGTVNLAATTTVRKPVFLLAPVSQRTATVTIKVLTSGKTVQIDGLGVSRS